MVAAPFCGPILSMQDQFVAVHNAKGEEIAAWKWKSGKVVGCGWSNSEEAVFVTEDGTVVVHDVFGALVRSFSMGQEAKDLKVASAKVFRSSASSSAGVAVLTGAGRFFVANNVGEPRVRRLPDPEVAVPACGGSPPV